MELRLSQLRAHARLQRRRLRLQERPPRPAVRGGRRRHVVRHRLLARGQDRVRLHAHQRLRRGVLLLRQWPVDFRRRLASLGLPRGLPQGRQRLLQGAVQGRGHPRGHSRRGLREAQESRLREPDQEQARQHGHQAVDPPGGEERRRRLPPQESPGGQAPPGEDSGQREAPHRAQTWSRRKPRRPPARSSCASPS